MSTVKIIVDRSDIAFASVRAGVSDSLMEIALEIEGEAKRSIMTGTRSGKTYRRSALARTVKTGGKRATALAGMGLNGQANDKGKTRFITGYKIHRASAEGESPANDVGALANSIQARRKSEMATEVVVGKEYGAVLEERNRPFITKAVAKVEPQVERIVQRSVDRRLP